MGCNSENMTRVVYLGETMLMLAPPRYELIEHCDRFTAYSGGSESNVAIGLERVGIHIGRIGKLPDNALGHKIVNGIRAYGVDTSNRGVPGLAVCLGEMSVRQSESNDQQDPLQPVSERVVLSNVSDPSPGAKGPFDCAQDRPFDCA